jgi:hypothetical protein
MQITLDDQQYERLRIQSRLTGASIAALIRRAVDVEYGSELTTEQRIEALNKGFGAWANRPEGDDPHAEWRALRPGMGPTPR